MQQDEDEEEDFFYRPHRARGQRLDPAVTRIALAAGGLTILVIIIASLWSGFHAGDFGPPPVIGPPDTPLRVRPASPGGLVVPGADVPIMSGAISTAPPQLAPQGQPPDIAELDQAAGLNQPPPAPPAAPAPATTAAAATPPANAAPPAAAKPAPSGPAQVQLAATADEGGAEAAWAGLQKTAPALLAGRTPIILPAVINGQSVWRVRLGGFSSAVAAQEFCDALIAKGAACVVAGW